MRFRRSFPHSGGNSLVRLPFHSVTYSLELLPTYLEPIHVKFSLSWLPFPQPINNNVYSTNMTDLQTPSLSAKDVALEEKGITSSVDSLSPLRGENAVHKHEFNAGDSLYARLQRFAGRYGVEQRGIERVPSDERSDSGMSQIGTMVLSS